MSLKTNLFRFIFISVLGVLLHFTYECPEITLSSGYSQL